MILVHGVDLVIQLFVMLRRTVILCKYVRVCVLEIEIGFHDIEFMSYWGNAGESVLAIYYN